MQVLVPAESASPPGTARCTKGGGVESPCSRALVLPDQERTPVLSWTVPARQIKVLRTLTERPGANTAAIAAVFAKKRPNTVPIGTVLGHPATSYSL